MAYITKRAIRALTPESLMLHRKAQLSMQDSTHNSIGDGGVNTLAAQLFRPRLLPIRPDSKRPYSVRDGGPRWGALGPASEDQINRWFVDLHPAWGVRTGTLPGLAQACQ